jgi:hypothetical protein
MHTPTKVRFEMKGRLKALLGICIAILIVSGPGAQGKKTDKPGETRIEWIVFDGDLSGEQEVEGCCPNAGPFPEYRMTLSFDVGDLAGTYDGQLFINTYGTGRNREYIVQFWNDEIGIEIIGGVIVYDRKNKVLTVTFEDEECVDIETGDHIAWVTFTLVRSP